MNKKIEVKNLQISFRTQGGILKAVRNISFDLYKGETLAIVGESGSGKSVTSKSIMGILAGNSIVEGGEIIYDGQDLLKISEDDMHKIRGDKIAMIFQDPMSSLNPIMKVGQQLTEAMILKNKSSKRNAKKSFGKIINLLEQNVLEASESFSNINPSEYKQFLKLFQEFFVKSTDLENEYNEAYSSCVELEYEIENALFLISKQQKIDITATLKSIKKLLELSIHKYVVLQNEQYNTFNEQLAALIAQKKDVDLNTVINTLNSILCFVKESYKKDKPNFFRLGFYLLKYPEANIDLPIEELDDLTLKVLNGEFLDKFINVSEYGVVNSHKKSISAKKLIVDEIKSAIKYFENENIEKNITKEIVDKLSKGSIQAIDQLVIDKNSTEYTFASALNHAFNVYFNGVKNNPIELNKYNKQKAKYEKLVNSGKTPDWKLKPANLVDLVLAKNNIVKILENYLETINNDLDSDASFNANKNVIRIIDYMKEQASKLVEKMTEKMAKAKALKLLDEVGIPDSNIRFNQYPFEFSGGMRQRIVIAIALSANPDILICDEPTTALDVTIQSQILELINRLKKERNLSVIFITHNLGVVANMADRIAVMYAGKIVEYGSAEDIFYNPKHPYTWALLSSMPDLYTKGKLDAIPGTPPNMIFPPVGDAFAPRNKYALEIDFEQEPPLFKVSDSHYAATWLLHPDAPKVEIPRIITERIERMKKEAEKDER